MTLVVAGCRSGDTARMSDTSDGADWAGYGRTFGEQHYSPLEEVDARTVGRLGLAWSVDIDDGNMASVPIAVDGVVYTATGYSVVRAIDAKTGRVLWTYSPKAAEAAGPKLRAGWGSRGLAYWGGRIYVGTQDGRLIALEARTGKPAWSVMTVGKDDLRFISGAPRLFDGKVIIGHGGADSSAIRGYVTTYDAKTGRQLWRFHIVPGNPAEGFENKAMAMAAKTWAGQWWKYGGGGTVWNAISYDPETNLVFLGTGNGSPWNHRVRSAGRGDNLFLSSIVALDADTGDYRWHYQTNPGESWDYNAAMDMALADLKIGGVDRKVLMTAPKNGFFYVLDRTTGKLISAEPITRVTWASRIDLATGRPVEAPGLRYPDGTAFILSPGSMGAHSWQPMAYSPKAALAFVPIITRTSTFDDRGIEPGHWRRTPGNGFDVAANVDAVPRKKDPSEGTSSLLAWDPVRQRAAWRVATPGPWNGGVMATSGGLVFQGQLDGRFVARAAATGRALWSFDAQAPMLGAPISYTAGGRQYITVLTGIGTSATVLGPELQQFGIDARTQSRRILTFTLDGKAALPPNRNVLGPIADDPDFQPAAGMEWRGAETYGRRCTQCHGINGASGGMVPDLRRSTVPASREAFDAIVRGGVLVSRGMPAFEELSPGEVEDARYFIRLQAHLARQQAAKPK